MSESDEEEDEKPFEATQKRLDEARRKGEFAKSADLTTAAGYAGVLLAALAFGAGTLLSLGEGLAAFLARAAPMSRAMFDGSAAPVAAAAGFALAQPLAPWFLLPAAAALLGVIVQQAFVVSLERIKPKLNRISPIDGAKQKFGRGGLFEFAKSTVKLVIYALVLGLFMVAELPEMLATVAQSPAQATVTLLQMSLRFLVLVVAISAVIGVIDFLWQRAEHLRKHRMSHKELADESKENEGDPYLRARRRDKAMEIATNRMIGDVPDATVVIVNPTHFAVALSWDRGGHGAPVCVAKGVDEVAARIREVAAIHGVPVHRDPPTARALHASLSVGEAIPPEHYRAVAAAIRFADALAARGRS
ncbi:MAG: flagellar type III secretion system protein FlhB [Pseudomonadota bacterium]